MFIIVCHDSGFGRLEMQALHAALRAIGPASLLCVRLAMPGEAAGRVEPLEDTLFCGTLDRLAQEDGPYEVWRSLCRQTHALWSVGRRT